ncbi:MAG: hypothetical protein IJW83_02930 [Clostridia bacterium]|nr:hypothetical protein [Clostridia bacterium]
MEQTVSASNPLGTERIGKLMVRFAVPSIIALVVKAHHGSGLGTCRKL